MGTTNAFRRHVVRVVLLLLPAAYLGQLLATAIHEFLGHGLAAVLLGGRFTGLGLAWDGMGWATVSGPDPATVGSAVAILAAGVVSTCVAGLLLLAASLRLGNKPARWVLLVLSACSLLEGASYAFWGAWHVGESNDIGQILDFLRSISEGRADFWRAVFLVAGGALTVLGTVLPLGRLLGSLEESFPPEIELARDRKILLAAVFGAAGVASWWLFDWEQLLPGVGLLPAVTGSALIAGTAAWFVARPPRGPRTPVEIGRAPLVASWVAAAAGAATTILWLGRGVSWA